MTGADLARVDAELEQAFPGPGLLASPWFWSGGFASLLAWAAIFFLVRSYF